MSAPDPLELAYLAGIVDADGFVTAQRQEKRGRGYWYARIGISGTRREPHDLAAALFGGRVRSYVNRTEDNRLAFIWERSGQSATEPITALLPYLRVKRRQAELALELNVGLLAGVSGDAIGAAIRGHSLRVGRRV